MSIFGVRPLGVGPYGGMPVISVLGVLPLSNNSWIVVFDREPKTLDSTSPNSATNPTNYVLTAMDPTYISATVPAPGILAPGLTAPTRFPSVRVAVQDEQDPTQIILSADSQLEPNVQYQVYVSNTIKGADCETFTGEQYWTFKAPSYSTQPTGVLISEQRYRDFAWKPYGEDGLEAFVIGSNNDIALDSALESLKKRIRRRVFTQKGSFIWDNQYGVGIKAKALIRSSSLQSLATSIASQIKLEPDVDDVSVSVRKRVTPSGTVVDIDCSVRMIDARVYRLVFND